MYNCILFDMDGTLVNSYEGIYHAYRVTMEKLGHPFGGEAFVRRAIGAPLPWVFQHLCRMEEDAVSQAGEILPQLLRRKGETPSFCL